MRKGPMRSKSIAEILALLRMSWSEGEGVNEKNEYPNAGDFTGAEPKNAAQRGCEIKATF